MNKLLSVCFVILNIVNGFEFSNANGSYAPNRRGIKDGWANRNIYSQFPYGVLEGITKVEWVSLSEVPLKLENSYGNIKELFLDE